MPCPGPATHAPQKQQCPPRPCRLKYTSLALLFPSPVSTVKIICNLVIKPARSFISSRCPRSVERSTTQVLLLFLVYVLVTYTLAYLTLPSVLTRPLLSTGDQTSIHWEYPFALAYNSPFRFTSPCPFLIPGLFHHGRRRIHALPPPYISTRVQLPSSLRAISRSSSSCFASINSGTVHGYQLCS